MKFKTKELFTIPNIITYFRLVCVPVFIWLVLDKSIANNVMYAFGIFLVASVSDLLDGFIARKFNQVSDIGKVLDPLADKLLQVSTLICLSIIGHVHYAFAIVLLAKEAYMVIGGTFVLKGLKSQFVVEANIFGKMATLVNAIGILLAFFHMEQFKNVLFIDWAILCFGCILAILAAGVYTYQFIEFYKKERLNKASDKKSDDKDKEN